MERKGRVGEVGRVLCFTKFHTPHHMCCSTLTTVQSVPGCSCHIIHTPHFMCSTLSELYDQFLAMEAEVHNEMLESITFIVDLRRFCFRAVQIMLVRGEGGGKIYFWIQGLFKIDTSTLGRDGAHCAALLHSTFLPLHLLCTGEPGRHRLLLRPLRTHRTQAASAHPCRRSQAPPGRRRAEPCLVG